jgi:hypothetical protein
MNIKLEELRKRLLEPVITPAGPSTGRYRRGSRELYADQPRSAEPDDSASDQRLPSAEAVVFWGNQRRIAQHPPRTADQAHSTEPDHSPSHQQSFGEAVASEPAPAPESPNGVSGAVLQYGQQLKASKTAEESPVQPNGQYQVAQAVANLFEQTQTFEDRFAELTGTFEPIADIGQGAALSLEPLQSFGQQMVQLAHSFESMRAFRIQLAQLAQTFEPMKGLQEQLAQLTEALQIHLNRLVGSLQHAREFQLELLKLARAFDPVADLQAQFTQLAETLNGTSATANGNEATPALPSVQR